MAAAAAGLVDWRQRAARGWGGWTARKGPAAECWWSGGATAGGGAVRGESGGV